MVVNEPTNIDKEELEQAKTKLLQEYHSNMEAKNQAVLEMNMERLSELVERTNGLMAEIDKIDHRLREIAGVIFGEQVESVPLTDAQKWLLAEIKQNHKQLVNELIRQRTSVVEQMKELRELDIVMGVYNKEASIEGAFLDQKK